MLANEESIPIMYNIDRKHACKVSHSMKHTYVSKFDFITRKNECVCCYIAMHDNALEPLHQFYVDSVVFTIQYIVQKLIEKGATKVLVTGTLPMPMGCLPGYLTLLQN